jgi:predicted CXXCH cytochrome family protein
MNQAMVRAPQVEGASFVENAACLDCHAQITQQFASSEHGRFHKPDLMFAGMTGCESCHGPGSKHIDAGGGRGVFIVNPASNASACLDCHTAQHAEFTLPHRHFVKEGSMNCTDCHEPHGGNIFKPSGGLLAMSRLNESCSNCHQDQARPFVFEHEALREGCTTCHQPHGSVNDKMLVQRDVNLCLKCHAQVASPAVSGDGLFIGRTAHSGNIMQGTCWTAGCHEAVHGSNVHPRLLY